jgi:dipeptidase E
MKNIIIASTSTVHGRLFRIPTTRIKIHFGHCILFIPYARPSGISHEEYTAKAASAIKST